MSAPAEVPAEAAETLLRVMAQAAGRQAILTPEAAAAMGAYLLAEIAKLADRAEGSPSVKQEWGSRSQVGQIYGMTGQRADDLLIPWAAAGKVRVITPTDPLTGKAGHRRYNLDDVAAMMQTAPSRKGA